MPHFKSLLVWLIILPIMLVMTILTYPLAFVLPFFAEYRKGKQDNNTKYLYGYYLPDWLSWFQTPDNSLEGDQGWREEHMQWRFKFPEPIATYLGRIGWLWRNAAYGVGLADMYPNERVLLISGNPQINDSPFTLGHFYIETQDQRLFQYRLIKMIPKTNYYLYLTIGWNICGLLNDPQLNYTATYAFSPRIKKLK